MRLHAGFWRAGAGYRVPGKKEGKLPEIWLKSLRILALAGLASGVVPALAQDEGEEPEIAQFPTTEFAEGAKGATVSVGDLTASISMVRRKEIDPDFEAPLLSVEAAGNRVLEAAGVASGLDPPAAEASIAEIDPGNTEKEVYFASFSGGAHCCTTVIIADKVGDGWEPIKIGEFDGDGNYLDDLDDDGRAEIVTVDNRFLYKFDCYACSAAPLTITGLSDGKLVDLSADPRFQKAHREWLAQIVDGIDPADRWKSPGFLAGWVAAKTRIGEGADAFHSLVEHWDAKADAGEDVCVTGGELEDCPRKNIAHLRFPDRLKLLLDETGYHF
jgi:hypothetical protein